MGNYIVYCICQYDKSELYANSAFKMVYFDGKSKRCSFTFMKMQCDCTKIATQKICGLFCNFLSLFLLFLLGTAKSTKLNFFWSSLRRAKLSRSQNCLRLPTYVQCKFGPLSSQQCLISIVV